MIVDSNAEFQFYLRNVDRLAFSIKSRGTHSVVETGGLRIAKSRWAHVAVTFNRGTVMFYHNGELIDSNNEHGNMPRSISTVNDIVIGKGWKNYDYHGLMNKLLIWNRALSKAEIKKLYDSQK